MSIQHSRMFCKTCNSYVMTTRPGPNHILHLLLSVITLGLWLPIWFLASIKIGGWRCQQCGRGGGNVGPAIVAIVLILLAIAMWNRTGLFTL